MTGVDVEPLLVFTIGQAPRTDLVVELSDVLGDIPIEVRGALDGWTLDEVAEIPPIEDADALHTRLLLGPNGGPIDVKISKKAVTAEFRRMIDEVGARPTVIGCTGRFNGLDAGANVLFPSGVLSGLVDALLPNRGQLGVLVPIPEQVESFRRNWSTAARPATVVAVKPGTDPATAAAELTADDVDLVILDCFGYERPLLDEVRQIVGKPVLSAVRVTALLAGEMLGFTGTGARAH